MILNQQAPRIVLLENFLTDRQCDSIIKEAQLKLRESKMGDARNPLYDTTIRQSQTAWLDNMMVVDKIANFLGTTKDQCEPLQVVHYYEGGYYKPHYDSGINGGLPHWEIQDRVCTALVYLNDVESGGETGFPKLNLKVRPKKGSLIIFELCDINLKPFENALHEACVVGKGEKWIANLWLHSGYDLPE
jgi:prolyl 4-hydroxylase